jgi:hypothetical protein
MAATQHLHDETRQQTGNVSLSLDFKAAVRVSLGYEMVLHYVTIVYMLVMIIISNILAHFLRGFYRKIIIFKLYTVSGIRWSKIFLALIVFSCQ